MKKKSVVVPERVQGQATVLPVVSSERLARRIG
jgi:hypothetical protein